MTEEQRKINEKQQEKSKVIFWIMMIFIGFMFPPLLVLMALGVIVKSIIDYSAKKNAEAVSKAIKQSRNEER